MTDDDKGLIILLTEWDKRESKELSPRVAHHIAGHIIAMKANIEAQAAEIERLKAEVKNAWCDDALPCRQLMDAKQEIERLREALGELSGNTGKLPIRENENG